MTAPELFAAITGYLTGYRDLFYVAFVWLVGLAIVDLIINQTAAAWARRRR